MSEECLIRNGAPTLAGIKTGSLFRCPCGSREELVQSLREVNERLMAKGLRIVPLQIGERSALVYLYRPSRLRFDLAQPQTKALLEQRGYDTSQCSRCVAQLMRRVNSAADFPHEIGLFLSYPPEDVQGFIDHGARDCKAVGCWKVYGDAEAAQRTFDLYKKCTKVYCSQYQKGKNIDRLAVAG